MRAMIPRPALVTSGGGEAASPHVVARDPWSMRSIAPFERRTKRRTLKITGGTQFDVPRAMAAIPVVVLMVLAVVASNFDSSKVYTIHPRYCLC